MAAIPVPSVNTPVYQSWGAEVANTLKGLKGYALVAVDLNKTSGADGQVQFHGVNDLGLSLVVGGIVSVDRQNGDAGFAVVMAESWVPDGAQVLGRMMVVTLSSGIIQIAANATRKFHCLAWGTPL